METSMIQGHKPRICISLLGSLAEGRSPHWSRTAAILPYLAEDFDLTVLWDVQPEQHFSDRSFHSDRALFPRTPNWAQKASPVKAKSPFHLAGLRAKYHQQLQQFVQQNSGAFDLVVERDWLWRGLVAEAFQSDQRFTLTEVRRGIESASSVPPASSHSFLPWFKARHQPQQSPLSVKNWESATGILVSSVQARRAVQKQDPSTTSKPIHIVSDGVDFDSFRVRDRLSCRLDLGLPESTYVLTYVSQLDDFQEAAPVIEALGRSRPAQTVLHVVGDGAARPALEKLAQTYRSAVVFHGELPAADAARYMAAADLCLAPQSIEAGWPTASQTLREALACGRPVVSPPEEALAPELEARGWGWLVENSVAAYSRFFCALPSRDRLHAMADRLEDEVHRGQLQAQGILLSWQEVAEQYKQIFWDSLWPSTCPQKAVYAGSPERRSTSSMRQSA